MIQSKLIFFSFLFFTGYSVHGEHKSEKNESEKSDLCANDWVDATFFGLGKLKRKILEMFILNVYCIVGHIRIPFDWLTYLFWSSRPTKWNNYSMELNQH